MRAAVLALRPLGPASLVIGVPVAPPSTCRELAPLVDRLVCLVLPELFMVVGAWYDDFSATSDDEVRTLLHEQLSPAAV
jgi:putative phosphoribosyl transferase